MYEELVSDLRKGYTDRLKEAADAIEELSREYESVEASLTESVELVRNLQQTVEHYKGCSDDWYKEACDYKAMLPRWIPVTERLPEDRSDVLAYLKYEVGGRIAAANYDKGMWQDCVMGGLYRTEEGVITHWMPIPQPPKVEV